MGESRPVGQRYGIQMESEIWTVNCMVFEWNLNTDWYPDYNMVFLIM